MGTLAPAPGSPSSAQKLCVARWMLALPPSLPPPGMGVYSLLGQPGPELRPSAPEKMCCDPSERTMRDKTRMAAGHQPQRPGASPQPLPLQLLGLSRGSSFPPPLSPQAGRGAPGRQSQPVCVASSSQACPGSPQPGVPEQAHQPGPGPWLLGTHPRLPGTAYLRPCQAALPPGRPRSAPMPGSYEMSEAGRAARAGLPWPRA